jgi:hypothetical protein
VEYTSTNAVVDEHDEEDEEEMILYIFNLDDF